MSSFRPRRPSAALVVSIVALIVALGGTAYAGGLVPGKNTVGTKQLKNNAVTTEKDQERTDHHREDQERRGDGVEDQPNRADRSQRAAR